MITKAPLKRLWTKLSADGAESLRDESGQAMIEYAIISSGVILALTVFGRSTFVALLQAYQVYMEGFYQVLALPIP